MNIDSDRSSQLDHDARSYRYYRNAVERHWDPHDVDLSADRRTLLESESDEREFDAMKTGLAKFGAGEQAVAEDLAPLVAVLEDPEDQLFLTTQLYEEAKHSDFFDRYWTEVINAVERDKGWTVTSPTEDRWFNDDYRELFERNERALARLPSEDTPENRAVAYCHYHLVVEGILAQTGYYGMQRAYSADEFPELPHLPGLVEGFTLIRSDEGRHVGFGMAKLKELITEGVDPALIDETVRGLVPLVHGITTEGPYETDEGIDPDELERYAAEKHVQRMQQIKDASAEIPDVDALTRLEGD